MHSIKCTLQQKESFIESGFREGLAQDLYPNYVFMEHTLNKKFAQGESRPLTWC